MMNELNLNSFEGRGNPNHRIETWSSALACLAWGVFDFMMMKAYTGPAILLLL